jgi:hypothetical protein
MPKQPNYIDRPTSPAALRLEAMRLLAQSLTPGRSGIDRTRDVKLAAAYGGLADNQDYLDKQEQTRRQSVIVHRIDR